MAARVSIALALLLASMAPTAVAAAGRGACPAIGATYTAGLGVASQGVVHRLSIELLPKGSEGSAVATLWRFQTFDRRSGKRLSEIAMHHSCPNGRGACSVAPPSRSDPETGLSSEVIELNRDFSPVADDATPYAIILPSFAQIDWITTLAADAPPELRFFTKDHVLPDFGDAQVWLLTACGPRR